MKKRKRKKKNAAAATVAAALAATQDVSMVPFDNNMFLSRFIKTQKGDKTDQDQDKCADGNAVPNTESAAVKTGV